MNKRKISRSAYKVAVRKRKQLTQTDLHKKAVSLLEERAYRQMTGLIRFSEARRVLCPCLNLSKHDFDVLVYELELARLLTIVPFNGIVITRTKGRHPPASDLAEEQAQEADNP